MTTNTGDRFKINKLFKKTIEVLKIVFWSKEDFSGAVVKCERVKNSDRVIKHCNLY